jgi:pilus assembly protein FimV
MRFRVVGTAASLLAVPGASFALGLGEIHLRSSLNAPLNAEIELTATAEELTSLRAQLASRDSFTRYGLDYPAFIAGIQVRTERLADGRSIIRLTSSAPMTEPFATLLVEASWEKGRFQREYTVLFDPPAFAPVPAALAPPVAAPVTGAGDRSAAVVRQPAPASVASAPVSPSTAAPANATSAARPGEYVVRDGDSLSAIARRQFGTGAADRAMIAIYRSNEKAFEGNINRLRAGSVLRLPDDAAVASVDLREAQAEIRRQAASWTRADAGGDAPAADPRLRLIPPATPGASGGSSAEAQALRDQVARLESQNAEARRLLDIQSAELARLKGSPAPAPAAPSAAPAAPTPPAASTESAQPPPAAVEPAPAPVEPVVEKPAKPVPVAAADTGPSLLDRLVDNWQYAAGGLAALLLLVFGVRMARNRRESASEDLAPFAVAPASGRDASSDTMPLRKPLADADDPSIVVEESGTHERLNLTRKDTRTVDLDDASTSMSVPALDATAAMDQSDPLAEADFHMAYGLYDQAADLVKLAIQREPTRRDLKLKLLEVFFVWGNKDQFLQSARELSDTRDASSPGEWEKVVIMGKQLAPDDALFSQSYSGAGPSSVDLNLEGGQNLIDFDLDGEPSAALTSEGGVDLDIGGSTMRVESAAADGLDFILDDPGRGGDLERTATTRQMAQPGLGGHDDGPTQRHAIDGPTVEQPGLGDISDTLVGKVDAHGGFQGSDQTAELAIDDLGLDLGKFDVTGTNANLLDDSQLARALDSSDAPTLVAGMDETSRRLVEEASEANQPTELLPMGDLGLDGGGATSRVSMLDLELDLDGNAETGKRAALGDGDFNLDLDVGSAEQASDAQYTRTQRIEPVAEPTQRDLEPVTMSEVGTKLDLARAYMDMGDPDGARSILREVLQEGSANQRQEAQRLIDSIPG